MPTQTILIVEDEEDLRDVFAALLRSAGYHVVCAENGAEALRLLQSLEQKPALVLLDLMMPVMSGGEFLKVLDDAERLAGLPVVVVSAIAGQEQAPGARAYLRKPLEADTLLRVVRDFCES